MNLFNKLYEAIETGALQCLTGQYTTNHIGSIFKYILPNDKLHVIISYILTQFHSKSNAILRKNQFTIRNTVWL